MMQEKIKEYLLSLDIDTKDKRYTMDFCKKTEYLDRLRTQVINELHENVTIGYGNVNSKICFIFRNEDSFEIIKSTLQSILDKLNLNFYDIYVTFIDKTKTNYDKKYFLLINEIYAIGADIVYIFDMNESVMETITNTFKSSNIPVPNAQHFISIEHLCNVEPNKKQLFEAFKQLIIYREL